MNTLLQKTLIIGLAEMLVCAIFWAFNGSFAYIFTLCVSPVAASILAITLIADRIDPSRISALYYYAMGVTAVVTLLTYGLAHLVGLG